MGLRALWVWVFWVWVFWVWVFWVWVFWVWVFWVWVFCPVTAKVVVMVVMVILRSQNRSRKSRAYFPNFWFCRQLRVKQQLAAKSKRRQLTTITQKLCIICLSMFAKVVLERSTKYLYHLQIGVTYSHLLKNSQNVMMTRTFEKQNVAFF